MQECSQDAGQTRIHLFDARRVAPRFRHAAIVRALDMLLPGESMRFLNDHDPLMLLAELSEQFGGRLHVAYLRRAPGDIVIDFTIRS